MEPLATPLLTHQMSSFCGEDPGCGCDLLLPDGVAGVGGVRVPTQTRGLGPAPGPRSQREAARPARLPDTVFPSGALPRLLRSRYLLFMKLAALQLMQQKASKMENPTSLENGDPPSSEPKPEDPPGLEAGSEEEGSSVSGLSKVKELAETIASDDGTGGAAVHGGSGEPRFCPCSWRLPAVACPSPERGRQMSARSRGRPGVAQPPPLMVGRDYLRAGRVSAADPRSREVIRNACKAVGSISCTAFDVRFNPDIFSPGKCYIRTGRILWGSSWGPWSGGCWPLSCHPCIPSAWLRPLLSLPQGFVSPSPARRKFGTRSSC